MKMNNYFGEIQVCLLVVISTTSALCLSCTHSNKSSFPPTFPKCDKQLIREIKLFWKGAGTPKNVVQQIEESGDYSLAITSRNYPGSNNFQCVFLSASSSSSITFNLTCKCSCSPPTNITYDVEEIDGVISNSDGSVTRYVLFFGNNVFATYFCSKKDGIQGPPTGSIYVNKQSFNDTSTQSTRRSVEGLMDYLGFEFIYSYGNECFKII